VEKNEMKIVLRRPPNFGEIIKVLPKALGFGVLFCYGDTIYNPSQVRVSQAIIDHEAIHAKRQLAMGVEEWWARYLADPQFRYKEELLAYRAEYITTMEVGNRAERRWAHRAIAKKLASPLYGCCSSWRTALKEITDEEG